MWEFADTHKKKKDAKGSGSFNKPFFQEGVKWA